MAGIFMTAGSLVIAFPRNLAIVYFGRSLVGIGAAFVYVPILKLIALWFPIHKFGLLTGIMVALGGLGGFLYCPSYHIDPDNSQKSECKTFNYRLYF